MGKRIFISYKRKDFDKVKPLIDEIERATGESCWYDLDGIETSAQFTHVICRAINEAEVVLYMHSKNSSGIDFEDDWTIKELNYARLKKKRIVLVKLDGTPLSDEFSFIFGLNNFIQIGEKLQREKLFKDLSSWFGKELPQEPAIVPVKEPVKRHLDRKSLQWILLASTVVLAVVLAIVLGRKHQDESGMESLLETMDIADTVVLETQHYDESEIQSSVVRTRKKESTAKTEVPSQPWVEWSNTQEPVKGEIIPVKSLSISQSEVNLEVGQSVTLHARVMPEDATNKTVTWASGDEQIVTVSQSGKVTAKKAGRATLFALCGHLKRSCWVIVKDKSAPDQRQTQSSSSKTGNDNGHEWVDLGLPSGTKWSTCNLGASGPTENGNYYAWGETSTKSVFAWSSQKYCTDSSGAHFSKYVPSDKSNNWSGSGSPDNKTRMDLSDDAARANWGGLWRIPTKTQWEELKGKCAWFWIGNGYEVTGPNGQSITIPAAGFRYGTSTSGVGYCGSYWTSSVCPFFAGSAWLIFIDSDTINISYHSWYGGRPVRPVTE